MFKRDMRLFPYTLNSAFFALCFLRYIVIGKGEFIMWVLYAVGSAFFSGITAILAKCGIRKTDSTVATAVRTVVVLVFSWLMVFLAGSAPQIKALSVKTWVFLILSGMATGASWLCCFKALQTGDINKVVPIWAQRFEPASFSLWHGLWSLLPVKKARCGRSEKGTAVHLPFRICYRRGVALLL